MTSNVVSRWFLCPMVESSVANNSLLEVLLYVLLSLAQWFFQQTLLNCLWADSSQVPTFSVRVLHKKHPLKRADMAMNWCHVLMAVEPHACCQASDVWITAVTLMTSNEMHQLNLSTSFGCELFGPAVQRVVQPVANITHTNIFVKSHDTHWHAEIARLAFDQQRRWDYPC